VTRPKHLRPRHRYLDIGIETAADASLDADSLESAIHSSAGDLLGDPGRAAIDGTVVQFDIEDGQGAAVLRVRRGTVGHARAAAACVHSVDGDPIGVHVRAVSGTLRGCLSSRAGA